MLDLYNLFIQKIYDDLNTNDIAKQVENREPNPL